MENFRTNHQRILLGPVRELFHVARYQPKLFFVEKLFDVKKCAVWELFHACKNIFQFVIMPAKCKNTSDPRFPRDCVSVTTCVTRMLPIHCVQIRLFWRERVVEFFNKELNNYQGFLTQKKS